MRAGVDTAIQEVLREHVHLLDRVDLTDAAYLQEGEDALVPWKAGGCRIAAEGIKAWLGPRVQLVQFNDGTGPVHVGVQVEDYVLDGDGVRTARQVELALSEGFGVVRLSDFSPDQLDRAGLPTDSEISSVIAAILEETMPRTEALAALGLGGAVSGEQ